MPIDVSRVQNDFHRSAQTYESDAEIQLLVIQQLQQLITPYVLSGDHVLDVGCGTGWLKDILEKRGLNWNLNGLDFAQAMCESSHKKGMPVVRASAESLPFASESHEMIFSSMCVQWLKHPKEFLAEAMRVLKPSGYLAFSTLGAQTLTELRQAFEAEGDETRVMPFFTEFQWLEMATQMGYRMRHMHSMMWKRRYDSMQHLCESLRATGALNKREDRKRGLLGSSVFSRVCASYNTANARPHYEYEGRMIGGGVLATWQPLLFIFEKPVPKT